MTKESVPVPRCAVLVLLLGEISRCDTVSHSLEHEPDTSETSFMEIKPGVLQGEANLRARYTANVHRSDERNWHREVITPYRSSVVRGLTHASLRFEPSESAARQPVLFKEGLTSTTRAQRALSVQRLESSRADPVS